MVERNWAIVVFGSEHKERIKRDMIRSFGEVFREHAAKYKILKLYKSPTIHLHYNGNLSMLLSDILELLEEQETESLLLLTIFINDSGDESISVRFRDSFSEKMFILDLNGDEFIESSSSNDRNSSYSSIAKWLDELSQCISEYESVNFDEHSQILSIQQDMPYPTEQQLLKGIPPETDATLPNIGRNKSGYMSETHSFENKLPAAHQDNEVFTRNNRNAGDMVPCKSIFHQQRPTFNNSYDAYRWGDNYNGINQNEIDNYDAISEFDMLMERFGSENYNIAPDENDLIVYIDIECVHNRLVQPRKSSECNIKLLRLIRLAISSEILDLQRRINDFIRFLFANRFLHQIFFDFVHPALRKSSFCNQNAINSLHEIIKILQIADAKNLQFIELMNDVNSFMERIPNRFWQNCSLELHDEIYAIIKSLNGANANDWLAKKIEYRPIWMDCDEVEPQEDFRKLSIRLVRKDIIRPLKPFLRRNKDDESFRDVEQYLDIQFRLLREDLISPMRDGIALWKQYKNGYYPLGSEDIFEQLDLFVINGVRVEGLQIKRSTGQLFRYVKFQPPPDLIDGSSQKLKFGQMVALSSDEFEEEALFAVIVERPDERSIIDRIGLSFCEESERQVSRSKRYTLVESSAYFEMYEHVLKTLKEYGNNKPIPFKRYLINCETNVDRPAYLKAVNPTDVNSDDDRIPTKMLSILGEKYDVNRLMFTLDGDLLKINQYQREALINALTQELALIQGPPGTGKTFVGRLIVRILIENISLWNATRRHPLLVVCYTNHALDHFLENLVDDFEYYNENVSSDYPTMVRLGSRCKNERIEKFSKANVTQEYEKLVSEIERSKARKVMRKRAKILDDIITRSTILFKSKSDIISYQLLSTVISSRHKGQLSCLRITAKGMMTLDEVLAEWLSIEARIPESEIGSNASRYHNGDESSRNLATESDDLESSEWDVSEDINDNVLSSKANPRRIGRDEFDSDNDNDDDKQYASMSWKQIEEALMQADDGIDEYYHNEAWDIVVNERMGKSSGVLIFSATTHPGLSKKPIRYDPNIVAKLKACKEKILEATALSKEEAESIQDLTELDRNRRWMLYAFWIKELKQWAENGLKKLMDQYQKHMVDVKKTYEMLDEIVLRRSLIIGATTTGAAKSRSLLQRIGCRIVIVEEAAEVLEAHILSSIVESCEHAILIGDHQQLRPNPAVNVLAKEYKLEISMFERLVKNQYPCSTLLYQHRMAPCISNTLMPHFYPLLEDADVVKMYPNVRGCLRNIFMLCHRKPETVTSSLSHRNEFEGDFAFGLFNYLLQQGYTPNQITILCTYAAQTGYVKSLMEARIQSADEYPRVDNVDAYQGEENDIVILSLVRSSPYDTIGFLANSNRICVALSRARIGFYLIGNIDFLAYHSHLWSKIAKSLEDVDAVGEGFPIICSKHGNVQLIYDADEFRLKSPNGGCSTECCYESD